jgi:ribonuclease HI
MKELIFFTDGSTLNNQEKGKRRGGVGVFFGKDDPRNISSPLKETKYFKVTNQVAELLACIRGIETLISSQKTIAKQIVIYTDSMYIINSISSWAKNWAKNDWKKSDGKTIKNLKLIKRLYYMCLNLGIILRHVKAHREAPPEDSKEYPLWFGNDQADKLAVAGAKRVKM